MTRLFGREARPATLLVLVVLAVAATDHGTGYLFSRDTVFSVLQLFATYGLVSLAVGLSLLVREFDISVAGMVGLAGAVAVIVGHGNPWLGAAVGLATGLAGGLLQGLLITSLRLGSVAVTLGGLMTFQGLTTLITDNNSVAWPDLVLPLRLNAPLLGLLSFRSVVVLAVFAVAALVMARTRIGRDVLATGGDRRASAMAGVPVNIVVTLVFAASGLLCALAGVLLSFGLGAASPVALSDLLAPAAAGAIIGGVSLVGGRGNPFGIAAGVLILCVLRSGLNAVGVSPYVQDIATGGILLAIAIIDAPDLPRRMIKWRLDFNKEG